MITLITRAASAGQLRVEMGKHKYAVHLNSYGRCGRASSRMPSGAAIKAGPLKVDTLMLPA